MRTRYAEAGITLICVLGAAALARHQSAANASYIRRAQIPEPHTIQELRSINKLAPMKRCSLPEVTPSQAWRPMPATDGAFRLSLPVPWRFHSMDTVTTLFDDPQVSFMDQRDSHIMVQRMAYGNSSRAYLRDSTGVIAPERECEVSNESGGTIWSFYALPRDRGEIRYKALADAVTSSGRHYHISISAWAASNRDSLAAILADAVIHQ